jgi:hypothetical protein
MAIAPAAAAPNAAARIASALWRPYLVMPGPRPALAAELRSARAGAATRARARRPADAKPRRTRVTGPIILSLGQLD